MFIYEDQHRLRHVTAPQMCLDPTITRLRGSGFALSLGRIEAGWVDATVQSDRYWAQLRASYLSDAIGDLLGAVVELTQGADSVRCSWFVEPGEYRWILARDGGQVALQILGFRDGEEPEPDGAGTFVFETTVALRVLVLNVTRCVERRAEAQSETDYEQEWDHPWPREAIAVLRGYLADSRE